jgi:hypothetical protein
MKRCLLPVLILAAGCGLKPSTYTPTPPPKVEPIASKVVQSNEVMPLQEGNQWTFELRVENFIKGKSVGSATQSVTYRVASVNGNRAVLLLEQDGKQIDRQEWMTTPEGIYQATSGLQQVPYNPPQPASPVPLEPGKKMHWSGTGLMADGSRDKGVAELEVLAPQAVDTGVGTLSAIPVSTVTTFGKSRSENTTWFRPGIGLIRLRQDTMTRDRQNVVLLTLTNYALKRQ